VSGAGEGLCVGGEGGGGDERVCVCLCLFLRGGEGLRLTNPLPLTAPITQRTGHNAAAAFKRS
jgi:hypothetical protein